MKLTAFSMLLVALVPGFAHAQTTSETDATRLFNEGQALIGEGKDAEACKKFEESQALDPAIGTEFFLADCYERVKRYVDARQHFERVMTLAKQTGAREREAEARGRKEKLDQFVFELRLTRDDAAPKGASLQLDEAASISPLPGSVFLDPGPHKLRASAPGYQPYETNVDAVAGRSSELTIRWDALPKPPDTPRPPPPDPGMPSLGIAAMTIGAASAIALGFATGFGIDAIVTYDKSNKEDRCNATNQCTQEGLDLREQADSSAMWSTGLFIGGGVAGAAAVTLALLIPVTAEPDLPTQIWLSPTQGGVSFSSSF
jgi:tetratricopeptide (TPR) repeat protein